MSEALATYPYVVVECTAAQLEAASDVLWEVGASGVEERDASTLSKPQASHPVCAIGYFDTTSEAELAVAELLPHWNARLECVVGDDWKEAWKAYFKPTRIGSRLIVAPSWEELQPAEKDVVLWMDPGAAFGTGTHATTQLLLRELDARIRGAESVLDVGCGSGILAIATLLLGARQAWATDIDPMALKVTQENAERNRVEHRLHLTDSTWIDSAQKVDVVIANIELQPLLELAPHLVARLKKGGLLLLSGLLKGQETDMLNALTNMHQVAAPTEGEWTALVLEKP